jgi:hypothetical protein
MTKTITTTDISGVIKLSKVTPISTTGSPGSTFGFPVSAPPLVNTIENSPTLLFSRSITLPTRVQPSLLRISITAMGFLSDLPQGSEFLIKWWVGSVTAGPQTYHRKVTANPNSVSGATVTIFAYAVNSIETVEVFAQVISGDAINLQTIAEDMEWLITVEDAGPVA